MVENCSFPVHMPPLNNDYTSFYMCFSRHCIWIYQLIFPYVRFRFTVFVSRTYISINFELVIFFLYFQRNGFSNASNRIQSKTTASEKCSKECSQCWPKVSSDFFINSKVSWLMIMSHDQSHGANQETLSFPKRYTRSWNWALRTIGIEYGACNTR